LGVHSTSNLRGGVGNIASSVVQQQLSKTSLSRQQAVAAMGIKLDDAG